MESKINYRKANPSDLTQILDLIRELAIFEKEPDAVVIDEAILNKYTFGINPLIYIYVAENYDKIVGIALYYYRFSTWKGKTLHLEDLIINENYRRLGIGKKLFELVLHIAKKEQVGRMEWEVLEWNQDAIEFYKNYNVSMDTTWNLCKLSREDLANIT